MTNIKEIISQIRFAAVKSGKPAPASFGAFEGTAWRITLKFQGRSMSLDYFMGIALVNPPSPTDVFWSIVRDSRDYYHALNFEDWASNFGFDTDSRKAEKAYNEVGKQAKRLQRLLGVGLYETVMTSLEDDDN